MKLLHPGDEVTVQRRGSRDDWRGEMLEHGALDDGSPAVLVRVPGGEKVWFDTQTGRGSGSWHLAAKHVPVRMGGEQ